MTDQQSTLHCSCTVIYRDDHDELASHPSCSVHGWTVSDSQQLMAKVIAEHPGPYWHDGTIRICGGCDWRGLYSEFGFHVAEKLDEAFGYIKLLTHGELTHWMSGWSK